MKPRTVATALVSWALTACAWADTYPRQPGIKVSNYMFDITLTDVSNEFTVAATVALQFSAPNNAGVDLDLCNFKAEVRKTQNADGIPDPCAEPAVGRNNAVPPSGGKGMTVSAVTAPDGALPFKHENDRLHVALPRSFQPGERYTFTVNYHGTPATGILVGNNKYGERSFFSNPWPHKARNYLASFDHPSMKAPVVTIINAPRRYQVISNGTKVEETDLPRDQRRTAWKEANPICTCLMSIGVAPMAVSHFGDYHGIPLSAWVYPEERDVSFREFSEFTQPILEFFIDHIGPYSYEKVAQVQANGISGGMELASSIFYGYGEKGPARQLIAHEMAHQWFGDSAAEKDWDDVWLSEGFATYFALLYTEFKDGHDAFLESLKRSKEQALNYALANPDSTIVHRNLADFSKVIANNAQIYQGGAQTLQNIRGVLGTGTFWAGIRLYYNRFQNGNANTDDFRHAMEDACKDAGDRCSTAGKDLGWLFRELLNRGGALQVRGSWHYESASKQVQVTLDQTQTSGLYQMPVEIVITTMETPAPPNRPGRSAPSAPPQPVPTPHREVAQLSQAHQTFTFPSAGEPVGVALDPDAWVMMRATFTKQ